MRALYAVGFMFLAVLGQQQCESSLIGSAALCGLLDGQEAEACAQGVTSSHLLAIAQRISSQGSVDNKVHDHHHHHLGHRHAHARKAHSASTHTHSPGGHAARTVDIVGNYGRDILSSEQLQAAMADMLACAADTDCSFVTPKSHDHDHEGHAHSHADHAHGHEDHGGHGHEDHAQEHGAHAHGSHGEAHAGEKHEHEQVPSSGASRMLQQLRSALAPGPNGEVTTPMKAAAALLLFVEAVVGMLLPALVTRMESHRWWMGCLNAFSGGIFLAAGVMHLIPHCEEAQAEVDLTKLHLPTEYPLYLLLVVGGYLLVFFVERVAFEGHAHHGHSHGHDCVPHDHSVCEERVALLRASLDLSKQHEAAGEHAHGPDGAHAHAHGHDHAGHAHGAACSHGDGHAHDGHAHAHGAHGAVGLQAPLLPLCDEGEGLEQHRVFRPSKGMTLLAGMTVHTALECLALGFITSQRSFLALLAAVASHKAISALALSARFMREGANIKQVLTYVGPFTLVAPVSIAFGAWAGTVAPVAHLVLSCFAAGTFLYVGCSEVLAEEFEGDVRCGRRDISQLQARLYKFGVVVFAVLSIAAMGLMPHEH